ncbi:hypothetical protein GW17_00037766 [Ensete ventricosum]|nr:hypothetical protein GW17_00037766 [Ensete ventricosum]RZS27081.1 hypothetical protein BHM03_00060508 [Ensete ventricosum]
MTNNSNTESLLPNRMSYACSFSYANDEFKNFQSYLRWMCIDQFDVRYTMVFWSLFLPSSGCLRSHCLSLHPLLCPHPPRL